MQGSGSIMCLLTPPILLCLLSVSILLPTLQAQGHIIAKPGCKDRCGNVSIFFPFGIGDNCFLASWYEVKCKTSPHSNGSAKALLAKFNIEIVEIKFSDHILSLTVGLPPSKVCTTDTQSHQRSSVDLRGSPYGFSMYSNSFVMEGCAGSGVLLEHQRELFLASCGSVCGNNESGLPANQCYGIGCCLSGLYPNNRYDDHASFLEYYRVDIRGQPSGRRRNCLAATLIATHFVDEYMGKLLVSDPPTVPVVLLWTWTNSLWPNETSPNVYCSGLSSSLHCYCANNSYGINPYVPNGCQVHKECQGCPRTCVKNEENNYVCSSSSSSSANRWSFIWNDIAPVFATLGVALGPLLMVFGCRCLYYCTKRRMKAEKRVKFFKLMLHRHQSSTAGVVERTKLFAHKELRKATNDFNENRVLGKGGQGTVYKGMLIDGRIVAVKKSKLLDEFQMEQFINEMVILSQINHRNVVKVLGCCLETEVPLLVYEFVSNGTLHQHIHEHTDADFRLSWAMRLRIAADSAGAIAYLHSSSSNPIYHRDIKPSNILLDDKYRAKVSDFGSSKTIAIDQTHLTTLVQGTLGYLDPEYFESNIFTEKSDVYSFGVVMLELLTGKKPIYRDETMEQKCLVIEFFLQMRNDGLSDMLDPEVAREAKEEELLIFINLAKQCLNESGRLRPTMKEVAMTLEMIIKPPAETSSRDQQAFTEMAMFEISEHEFTSSTITAGAPSPLYIDVQPLLRDTI